MHRLHGLAPIQKSPDKQTSLQIAQSYDLGPRW